MAKSTCEAAKKLPITFLRKQGYFRSSYISGTIRWTWNEEPSGSAGISVDANNGYVRCVYTRTSYWDGEKEDFDYMIRLTTTPCYFGGYRYWFICPLTKNGIYCGRRVGVLYLAGDWFGCRECYDLAYDSQQETHTGGWSFLGKVLRLEGKLYDDYVNMRVKYWKGAPTKRYRRWLRRSEYYDRAAPMLLGMQKRLLGIGDKGEEEL